MNKNGIFYEIANSSFPKVVLQCAKSIFHLIFCIVVYFGLYLPIFHLIVGGIISAIFSFGLFDLSEPSLAYIISLILMCCCSVIVSIKNLIVKPLDKHINKVEIIKYNGQKPRKHSLEPPQIYKSKKHKGVIVYEYSNRYDLYQNENKGLVFLYSEPKTKKEQAKYKKQLSFEKI